jgi:hypothetical protein
MLVCESMETCISICTCANSSIRHSCHLIPSTARSAWSTPQVMYRSKGAYQLWYLAEAEVPARRIGLGNCERGSNHPHGNPSSHPHTRYPTGAPVGRLQCSHGLLCCLHASSPVNVRWSYEEMACLSHLIKL